MGRPTSKPELLAAAEQEFDRLWDTVDTVPPSDREAPGACGSWSVKDILAHLDAWDRMWLRWEQAGVRGEPTPMPAEGFTWAQTPALNERIHADTGGARWDAVCARLRDVASERRRAIPHSLLERTPAHWCWHRDCFRLHRPP